MDSAKVAPPDRPVPGILTFIAADIANFILFFGYFMVERLHQPAVFARSAAMLDVRLGLLNTVILITSGWLVALAVEAARAGDLAKTRARLLLAGFHGMIAEQPDIEPAPDVPTSNRKFPPDFSAN